MNKLPLDCGNNPQTKEIDVIYLDNGFGKPGKLTLYMCPKCCQYGLPSMHGRTCTGCANKERFLRAIDPPVAVKRPPWWERMIEWLQP